MDRGAWQATVHSVAESDATWTTNHHHHRGHRLWWKESSSGISPVCYLMVGSKMPIKTISHGSVSGPTIIYLLMDFVCGPDTVLEVWHVLHHLIPTAFHGRDSYYLCFADRNRSGQKSGKELTRATWDRSSDRESSYRDRPARCLCAAGSGSVCLCVWVCMCPTGHPHVLQ